MDFVTPAISLLNKGSEIYSDYDTGRSVRLGKYKGGNDVKNIGHYSSKTGKRLAIYHG